MEEIRNIMVFFALVFLFAFCEKEARLVDGNADTIALSTKAGSSSVNCTEVSTQEAEVVALSFANGRSLYSIIPIIEDGKNLMYTANYDDGWAIISGDTRIQKILAYNETGSFNPDSICNPGVAVWLNVIKEDLKNLLSIKAESSNTTKQNTRAVPRWWWVRELAYIDTISQTTSSVSHLMSTTWGQNTPWNNNCPYDINYGSRCPTGCVAVAMSQILYYYNYFRNKPSGFYHTVGYSSPYVPGYEGTFYRTDYYDPSTAWMGMAKNKGDYAHDIDAVGDLMLDVGNRVSMDYHSYGSAPTSLSRASFGYYNLQCDSAAYSASVVKASLDNEVPVMISAYPQSGAGHSWVIDGYHETVTIQDNHYEWHRIYTAIPDPEYDLCYIEPDVFSVYPNIYEGMPEIIRTTEYSDRYLLMNWGWDDTPTQVAYNDGHYAIPEYMTWTAGGINYTTNKWIFYGFN